MHLSRSQIKKIVQKVSSRDTVYYRKLTDKVVQEGEENILEDSEVLKEARLASEAQFYKSLLTDEDIGKGSYTFSLIEKNFFFTCFIIFM